MVLAAYRDNLYNLVLLLHLLAVIVAFAPMAAHPLGMVRARQSQGEDGVQRFSSAAAANTRVVYLPALVLAGGFGLLLVVLSDGVWGFDRTWISLAFLNWIALAGVVSAVLLPGERRLGAGEAEAEKRIAAGGQLATVLLLLMLYLMVFKPG